MNAILAAQEPAMTESEPHVTGPQTNPRSAHALLATAPSNASLWTGRVLSGLGVLFLGFDASMKLLRVPAALEATGQLGYPPSSIFTLGLIQLACLILYLLPRTAPLGAVLWTGYLGGAIATHVRVENPLLTHILFPVYVALLLWGGLWLREPRLRSLLPILARKP